MTLLIGVPPEPESIRCGMPVEAVFTALPDGNVLPVFRPRPGAPAGPAGNLADERPEAAR